MPDETETPGSQPSPSQPFGAQPSATAKQNITTSIGWSLFVSVVALIVFAYVGSVLFFSSSLEFDYMKMRNMPLYGNASTIGDFSRDFYTLRVRMHSNDDLVRDAIRDRSVIDLKIAGQQSREQAAVSNAKAALYAVLNPDQKSAVGNLSANYGEVDRGYVRVCNQPDAGNINDFMAGLPQMSTASSAASSASQSPQAPTRPGAPDTAAKTVKISPLTPQVSATVCSPMSVDCDNLTPVQKTISQVNMRCEELRLQVLKSQKAMTTDYGYDSAKVLYDILRVGYPDLQQDEIGHAEKVVDTYLAINPKARKDVDDAACHCATCSSADPAAIASGDSHSPCSPPVYHDKFWDKLLGWPLVASYVIIVVMFGIIGRMTKYYFDFAKPGKNPEYTPVFPIIQGASSALIVFMLCAAGFQFLTASAGGPDLAYPNPLTVCGLGLIAGVGADVILDALGKFIQKFASNTNTTPQAPPQVPQGQQPPH